MNNLKTRLFLWLKISPLLIIIPLLYVKPVYSGQVVLKDNKTLIAFDTKTGALIKMESLSPHWVIERRPELGVSFRLFVPLPRRRYNFVLGQEQRAVKVVKVSDHEIQIEWEKKRTCRHTANYNKCSSNT